MKRTETSAFLLLFYRKRTTSFLANIYKASITGDSKDIHRARLDAKKIMALYDFFDLLEQDGQWQRKRGKLFKPLFRSAGQIREIQVNYLLLETAALREHVPAEFTRWLRHEEQSATRKFIKTIKKFDEEELQALEKEVRKICTGSALHKYRSKSRKFLEKHKNTMDRILAMELTDKSMHEVRKLLKAMSTISSIVYSLKPATDLDRIISAINKTEMLIGEWHDRVVLEAAIDRFLAMNVLEPGAPGASMARLKEEVVAQKLNYVQHFLPEVRMVIKTVDEQVPLR
jgi:hypothetical protein